jgi:hypothetical protein
MGASTPTPLNVGMPINRAQGDMVVIMPTMMTTIRPTTPIHAREMTATP